MFNRRILLITLSSLVLSACAPPSPLIQSLNAISIAADVSAPVVAALSPGAAGWVSLVPPAVTTALDVASGSSPSASALAAIGGLQALYASGQLLLSSLTSSTDRALIGGTLAAIAAGITLYQQEYGTEPLTSSVRLARAIVKQGPVTTKKDRKVIALARFHLAHLVTSLAMRKS